MAGAARGAEGPRPSWSDRLHALRNRLLASPRFQRLAAAFPPTRPVARRRARALFDLCAGFVYAQVLAACVELRLFEILRAGPQTGTALALRLGLPQARLCRLLDAAASLDLLDRRGPDRYALGTLGAATLGNPGVAAMVAHHGALYRDLADPVALIRGGGETALAAYWPYAGAADPAALPPESVRAYTALMSASQPLVAAGLLDAYPFARHRRLLDIGAGDGTFLEAVAARAPGLALHGFDLPAVAGLARARFARLGLAGRAAATGGDVFADPLPGGFDLATLVRVIHDHDDPEALRILRAARAALAPGGTLLIAEPLAGAPGGGPIGDAYFAFYLLAMGSGRARTAAELERLAREAGFARAAQRRTDNPILCGLVVAETSR